MEVDLAVDTDFDDNAANDANTIDLFFFGSMVLSPVQNPIMSAVLC